MCTIKPNTCRQTHADKFEEFGDLNHTRLGNDTLPGPISERCFDTMSS